jgi:uncharacterized protein YdhG (YjbR/CyaY superfamily)
MKLQHAAVTIDDYIRQFPEPVRKKLTSLRTLVRKLVPEAKEKISYGMPCFYLNGNLVYFAAHATHIGLYPTPSGITAFKKELAGYECSKGAIQFPTERTLPVDLISKIVRFRRSESLAKAGTRPAGKPARAKAAAARPTASARGRKPKK